MGLKKIKGTRKIYQITLMLINVSRCLPMSTDVSRYQQMSADINKYQQISVDIIGDLQKYDLLK